MSAEKDRKTRTRRKVLKLLGTVGSASAFSTGVAAAAGRKKGNKRTLRPETAGLDTVDEVVVVISEGGGVRVDMGGTIEPGTPARGYTTEIHHLRGRNGKITPNRAQAVVKRIPNRKIPDEARSNRKETVVVEGTSDESDGPQVMTDGGDNQSDGEGGCWVRSEDPADLDLALTEFWMAWDRSGRNVDWWEWRYKCTPYQYYFSNWWLENDWFGNADGSNRDVDADMGAEYKNYNWRGYKDYTTADHRLNLSGDPDGSLTWWTSQWHEGEDDYLLRTDTGHYTHGLV